MATANFQARLERIQQAQQHAPRQPSTNFRSPGIAGIAASNRRRRRNLAREHLVSLILGTMLGGLIAVALIGLSLESAPWGPGTEWHNIVYIPTMVGLAAAPALLLVSLFMAQKKPGFAIFSLGYLSGVVITLFI